MMWTTGKKKILQHYHINIMVSFWCFEEIKMVPTDVFESQNYLLKMVLKKLVLISCFKTCLHLHLLVSRNFLHVLKIKYYITIYQSLKLYSLNLDTMCQFWWIYRKLFLFFKSYVTLWIEVKSSWWVSVSTNGLWYQKLKVGNIRYR